MAYFPLGKLQINIACDFHVKLGMHSQEPLIIFLNPYFSITIFQRNNIDS